MEYLGELRAKWRPLLAAVIGLGSGFSLSQYTTSTLAPLFVKDLGWANAQFAAIGSLAIFAVVLFPLIGRLTDVLGVRKVALIGVISMPAAYLMLSMMSGDIRIYIALYMFQAVFCITTTAVVYSRVVVQHIVKARGMALGIVASGPAVVGLIGGPLLNNFAEANGWRAGYVALAIFSAVGGVIALALLPSETRNVDPASKPHKRRARDDYPAIFRARAFWVMLIALLLTNLPQVVALTQMKFILEANGVTALGVSGMISAFAFGQLAGRFISGYALDHMPASWVAAFGMGLPAVGLFLLASSLDSYAVLMMSVLALGLAYGAEGDIVGYLVARNFGVSVYSSVYGLLMVAISASASCGALIFGIMLDQTGTYDRFLIVSGAAVLIGCLFGLLRGDLSLCPSPETQAPSRLKLPKQDRGMVDDTRGTGLRIFGEVYGKQAADRFAAYVETDDFGVETARWAADFCFGTLWSRDGLDRKNRSSAVLGMMIALRQFEEIRSHTKMGMANGLTKQEIEEILYSAVPYCGLPASNLAKAAMRQAFVDMEESLPADQFDAAPTRNS